MKKSKRIFAILAVIFLVSLYLSALFFAFSNHERALDLLVISLAATFFIPVLIYAFQLFRKARNDKDSD